MKQMGRSFKQALDLDMGAQMVHGAIDPETSVVADDLTPYCLRHTYATDLQSADVPINVAKDFLGHKSIDMTSQIYIHLSVDAFAEASLKVINFQHAQQRKKKEIRQKQVTHQTAENSLMQRILQKSTLYPLTEQSA